MNPKPIVPVCLILVAGCIVGINCGKKADVKNSNLANNVEFENRRRLAQVQTERTGELDFTLLKIGLDWKENLPRLTGKEFLDPQYIYTMGQVRRPRDQFGNYFDLQSKAFRVDYEFFDVLDRQSGVSIELKKSSEWLALAHVTGHRVEDLVFPEYEAKVALFQKSVRDGSDINLRWELEADYLAGVACRSKLRPKFRPETIRQSMAFIEKVATEFNKRRSATKLIPDPLTYGTLELRTKWTLKGFESGKVKNSGPLFSTKI